MADEKIVVEYVVESEAALKSVQKLRAEIDIAKQQIIDYAKQFQMSYAAAAEAMQKAYEAQQKGKIDPLLGPNTKEMKAAMAAATADAKEYGKVLTSALGEINASQRKVIDSLMEDDRLREQSIRTLREQQRLVATEARSKGKEIRAATSTKVATEGAKVSVAEAEAAAKVQIAASKAAADAEVQAQVVIREQIETTLKARTSAAAISIAEAKAAAQAELERAKVLAANSDVVKQAAAADKAQASARIERAKAIQEEAKAANAAAMEAEKVRQAQVKTYKDAADAYIRGEEAKVAAQTAKARADQQSAMAADKTAQAESRQAKATIDAANAANADALAQAKLTQEQNKATKSVESAEKSKKKLTKATRDVADQNGKFAGSLGKLNGVLRLVFGTALGITAINVLSKFRQGLLDAAQVAEQFTRTQFALALALREIQRRGGEVNFGKVSAEIEALFAQFGVFSKTEIIQSFTDVSLRLSRFGASADQVGKIVQTALVLKMTDVESRFDSVADAAKVLATYLGSGYGEGLERAGAIAGRAADQLIAFENGLRTLYGASIDPLERAMLRIDFIFRQFSGQMKDAGIFVETAAGRIEKASSKIKDAQVKLGQSFLGVSVKAREAWSSFVEDFVTKMAPLIYDTIVTLIALMEAFGVKLEAFKESLGLTDAMDQWVSEQQQIIGLLDQLKNQGDPKSIEKYNRALVHLFETYETSPEKFEKLRLLFPQQYQDFLKASKGLDEYVAKTDDSLLSLGDLVRKFKNETMAEFDTLNKGYEDMFSEPPTVEGPITGVRSDVDPQIMKDAQDEITDIIKDAEKDRLDLEKAFWDDMGQVGEDAIPGLLSAWNQYFAGSDQITVDGLEDQQDSWEQSYGEFGEILNDALDKAMDIWRDYYEEIADIARKEIEDIADENREFQQKLEDNRRDMQQKLADAARKYREEELKAERDYQEKLRRLREEYLFDLEDALRERDALQVIRLMRRYALDKQQLEREHENESEDRAEAYRNEIEDIRRQAQRKEEELRIEHQRRLEEIALQAQREREQAEIERQRDMEKLAEDIEKERQMREEKYAADQKALEEALTEKIATIIEKYVEEGELTSEQLSKLSASLQEWANETIQTHWDVASQIALATSSIVASLAAQEAAIIHAAEVAALYTYQPVDTSSLSPMGQANYTPPQQPYMPPGTGYAEGGISYATKPTWAMYGEAGPEVASFTPVGKFNTNSRSPVGNSNLGGLMGGSASGKVRVEVMLSPELIARVIDDTLDQSAQIIESALSGR